MFVDRAVISYIRRMKSTTAFALAFFSLTTPLFPATPDYSKATEAKSEDFAYLAPPEIPPEVRERRTQAPPVILGFVVGADGKPQQIAVLKSSGMSVIDEVGKTWLRACRMKPGQVGKVLGTAFGFQRSVRP